MRRAAEGGSRVGRSGEGRAVVVLAAGRAALHFWRQGEKRKGVRSGRRRAGRRRSRSRTIVSCRRPAVDSSRRPQTSRPSCSLTPSTSRSPASRRPCLTSIFKRPLLLGPSRHVGLGRRPGRRQESKGRARSRRWADAEGELAGLRFVPGKEGTSLLLSSTKPAGMARASGLAGSLTGFGRGARQGRPQPRATTEDLVPADTSLATL